MRSAPVLELTDRPTGLKGWALVSWLYRKGDNCDGAERQAFYREAAELSRALPPKPAVRDAIRRARRRREVRS